MNRRIAILQGHPDPAGGHLCHALAEAYAKGALDGGHEVKRIEVAGLAFPWLRTKAEYEMAALPPALKPSQDAIAWAAHLVVVYPLWLGTMPAILKAFLEQVARPGFAFKYRDDGRPPDTGLAGKSARIVVTMGMPALIYRWYFGAHGLKNLERSILGFVGIGPIRESLFGRVEAGPDRRARWLKEMEVLGRQAR